MVQVELELDKPLLSVDDICKLCYSIYDVVTCAHCKESVCTEPLSCSLYFPDRDNSEMFICYDCVNTISKKFIPLKKKKKRVYKHSDKLQIYSPIVIGYN